MAKYTTLVLFIMLLILVLLFEQVPSVYADWSPWSCQWSVINYPVSTGYLNGRGCASWWRGIALQWMIWGDTYVPTSTEVFTMVIGYDSCDGGNTWTYQNMIRWHSTYNTWYGTSGDPVVGPYQNCSQYQIHKYRIDSTHTMQPTPGANFEGKSGTVIF